jgi:hypothetical protein
MNPLEEKLIELNDHKNLPDNYETILNEYEKQLSADV